MRYTTAWAHFASQNLTLKVTVGFLTLALIVLAVATTKLATLPPLLIERQCHSRTLTAVDTKHTEEEIKSFVILAVEERFDSGAPRRGFLSAKEQSFWRQEQQKLAQGGMRQKVIVNGVKMEGDQVSIDADRLISVKDIRSAFPFSLLAKVSTISRSEDNPYGLQLEQITQLSQERAHE